ncbi:MAG: YkgJ family cysteine cluster protein [Oscillatoriales cyanobacterium RM1_1_9]|nr:YkgJ family cysteine cluster protein [Oscillatoriales cyanobacterium SM2_3_0]NJO47653.1 YkgJ family cysteine cluster protein [Oscillatoriales cyanobacterium RM2_1_1]NJO71758.1 YkgJ family cysteine cluster protein [Oscillatoriales cyanobacterium RM1_1_9]
MQIKSNGSTWRCMKNCGACCNLEPADRPDLDQYLSPVELIQYLGLVGEGGWCIHFDHETRECQIYSDRPRFCRVEPEVFYDLYGTEPEELNDFAIACCQEQIGEMYGDRSPELSRFNQEIAEPRF